MDMAEMKSGRMSPEAAGQMKQMGMDKMITISLPEKKVAYLIYPGMQSYVENPITDPQAAATPADYKVAVTELGKDTVDGHSCVKNKVTVTDKEGNKHESTVWNAADLKNFPVKIETSEGGRSSVMLFKNVSLTKPDAGVFETPSGYTKYESMQSLIQQQMMKRMGGGMLPFGH
jgi:chemotaxis protein CheY-P-specific phosphatase CheC